VRDHPHGYLAQYTTGEPRVKLGALEAQHSLQALPPFHLCGVPRLGSAPPDASPPLSPGSASSRGGHLPIYHRKPDTSEETLSGLCSSNRLHLHDSGLECCGSGILQPLHPRLVRQGRSCSAGLDRGRHSRFRAPSVSGRGGHLSVQLHSTHRAWLSDSGHAGSVPDAHPPHS